MHRIQLLESMGGPVWLEWIWHDDRFISKVFVAIVCLESENYKKVFFFVKYEVLIYNPPPPKKNGTCIIYNMHI